MKLMSLMAGRYKDKEDKEDIEFQTDQKCRFGFCWWYWLPRFKIRLKSRYKDISVTWFCFMVSFEGLLNEAG